MSGTTNTPVLYLVWWKYHDPYDGSHGILGIFDTEDAAKSFAEEYASQQEDINEGSCVTTTVLNMKNQFISPHQGLLHEFHGGVK